MIVKEYNDDVKKEWVDCFVNKNLIPLIGTGMSVGLSAKKGIVPDSKEYMQHMIKCLDETNLFETNEIDDIKHMRFDELCALYENDDFVSLKDRLAYLTNNFSKVQLPDSDVRKIFYEIEWPYIYSLNIDDSVENNTKYNKIIKPGRDVRERIFENDRCVLKIHGDIEEIITYKDAKRVFTTKEYAKSITESDYLLTKLKNDFNYQNIIVIGCRLSDEFDLLSLDVATEDIKDESRFHKIYFLMRNKPSKFMEARLKSYNVTDVICFDSYDSIYRALYQAWVEAQNIGNKDVDAFKDIAIKRLDVSERERNQNYFFWAASLFDEKNRDIVIPSFFIKRKITEKILKNFVDYKIHIIEGGHFSGETYLLIDLIQNIKDRQVCYISGQNRITKEGIEEIIERKKVVALFDVGAIDRDGLELILVNSQTIHDNENNFVIAVRNNDSDALGIVKWKLREKIITVENYCNYSLANKLEGYEEINKIFPNVGIPPMNKDNTFLDHLLSSQTALKRNGKFSDLHIRKSVSVKEIVTLIALGIKEKVYSSDIVVFGIEKEVEDICKEFQPFIVREYVNNSEKSKADLSSYKYVVNSKFWLYKELGRLIEKNENGIVEAFEYLVRRLVDINGDDSGRQMAKTRDFILFDKLNEIFYSDSRDNIFIIMKIYKRIEYVLSTDYQYLHQYSKGLLANTKKKDANEKKILLQDAYEKAILAAKIIENEYLRNSNEKLLISLAHVKYTVARICCRRAEVSRYNEWVDEAIEAITDAKESFYNDEVFNNNKGDEVEKFTKYIESNFERYNKPIVNNYIATVLRDRIV